MRIVFRSPSLLAAVVGFCAICNFGCASGPEKPDPLTALTADDNNAQSSEPQIDETASDAGRTPDGTIPFGKGMIRPTMASGPVPSLPPEAIKHRVMGLWVARCVITEVGSVEDCRIIKGLPDSDAHILQIIQSQKYTPVIYEGKPQRVYYTFKVTFR